MTPRQQLLFERALCLCANEHGHTRAEMLAWLNDDTQDWRLDYPVPYVPPPGALPFIQVSRTSNVSRP